MTAGTYLKRHHFRDRERVSGLHRDLLAITQEFDWRLEAWAVFSNHYHFVGHSPKEGAQSLARMLGVLHEQTGKWIDELDDTPGRKGWFNFRETRLTYHPSYLARLRYTHENAVKYRLVPKANHAHALPYQSKNVAATSSCSCSNPMRTIGFDE